MENQTIETVDFLAIGVGPFNLGLACLADNIEGFRGVFIDKKEKFDWHPGMLLQDTTLQVPFLADLVTLADPTNPFSFLNYLKSTGRIYSFYIKENFLILRNEYNQYCQWAILQLENVHFNTEVIDINYAKDEKLYIVTCRANTTKELQFYKTKKLVIGTGTQPHIPTCASHLREDAKHTANYLMYKEHIQEKKAITVVGSGQSAAEVFHDLLQDIDTKNYKLNWITRSPRFFPLEYTKLTLEMTSPEYVDYFHALDSAKRDELIKDQKHLYKGINQDLIGEIFDTIYAKKILSKIDVQLRTNSELYQVDKTPSGDYAMIFHQKEENKFFRHEAEEVIFATGYQAKTPDFLDGISNRIQWDAKGRYDVNRNYSVDINENEIFVQNAELHTHGFVTPDLGMGAYRNTFILNEMMGEEHFKIEQSIAFQQFGVSKDEEVLMEDLIPMS